MRGSATGAAARTSPPVQQWGGEALSTNSFGMVLTLSYPMVSMTRTGGAGGAARRQPATSR
jgi:hypothetical protein